MNLDWLDDIVAPVSVGVIRQRAQKEKRSRGQTIVNGTATIVEQARGGAASAPRCGLAASRSVRFRILKKNLEIINITQILQHFGNQLFDKNQRHLIAYPHLEKRITRKLTITDVWKCQRNLCVKLEK